MIALGTESKKAIGFLFPWLLLAATIVAIGQEAEDRGDSVLPTDGPMTAPIEDFVLLRDTVYVLGPSFVEIDRQEQMVYLHLRDGGIRMYEAATGDSTLPEGVATPLGLFSINWKTRDWVSTIYDVMMHNWMPFYDNIGMHSLETDAYLSNLGEEPISHGCVRLAPEAASEIFENVWQGTPVLVHDGRPARILQFENSSRSSLRIMESLPHQLLQRRLEAVQRGHWGDSVLRQPLALPEGKFFRDSIGIGQIDLVGDVRLPRRSRSSLSTRPVDSNSADRAESSLVSR